VSKPKTKHTHARAGGLTLTNAPSRRTQPNADGSRRSGAKIPAQKTRKATGKTAPMANRSRTGTTARPRLVTSTSTHGTSLSIILILMSSLFEIVLICADINVQGRAAPLAILDLTLISTLFGIIVHNQRCRSDEQTYTIRTELLDAASVSTRDEVTAMLGFIDEHCAPVLSSISPLTGRRHRPLEEWQEDFCAFRDAAVQDNPHWPCKTEPANELLRILSAENTSNALRAQVGR
jgi:hypothetical protein